MPTDQLSNVPAKAWQRAVGRLRDVGVFADEEREFLSLPTVQSLLPQIEQRLRSAGYAGYQLEVAQFDPPQDGVNYLLFDKQRLDGPINAQAAWRDDYERRWHERVKARVKDWLRRLALLRSQIEQWAREARPEALHVVDRQPALMNEHMMRRFRVPPAEMPTYEIVRDATRLMRVQPKGLWVVGANGRVDMVTRAASLILIDASEPGSDTPNWQIYRPSEKNHLAPFDRNTFLGLLQQAAA